MITGIFERKEKKYILSPEKYTALLPYIKDRMAPGEYPLSDVCNIYYDTADNRVIRESIDKPLYKEKLRLRAYQVPKDDTDVFLEVKKKMLGTVYKRRIMLKYAEALDFLENGAPETETPQVLREIDYMKKFYTALRPAMFISYRRLSYVGKEDLLLRVTFDDRLLYRNTALELSAGNWGDPIIDGETVVMEIKTSDNMPLWLSNALDKCRVFPGSFSKYGTAYAKTAMENVPGAKKIEGVVSIA